MASESIACNGFYTEHGNSVINNYFPQLNGTNNGNNNVPAGGTMNSSGSNSSTNNVNGGTNSTTAGGSGGGGASNNIGITPGTTTGTGRQSTGSNSSTTSTSQWTNLSSPTSSSSPSQQQQQQQRQAQQTPQTPQTPQTQQPQHRSHHHHQQQQHHTHHHQQQQQQQPQHQDHLVQNIPTTSNAHSIFGGGFHHRTNNPWGLQNLAACYQRMQQHNENAYAQNFHSVTLANGQLSGNNSDTPNSNLIAQHQQQQQHQLLHHQQQQNHQNFKRFGLYSGKSGNSKDICGDDKFKEDGDPWNVEAQAAFLGPNLWDKTLPYDADLKVTQYADLDEFLSENNIPDGLPGTHLGHSTSLGHRSDSLGHSTSLSLGLGHITTKRERSPSPSDCVSPDTINPPSPAESTFSFASSGRDFDPRTRAFSDEELKPQPMIKKSRKQFVPDELKDDKYWARRRKNNIAAKRSRDARRQKENQIAMRARYLEKENSTLHQEVEQLKQENMELRARLSKYQEV